MGFFDTAMNAAKAFDNQKKAEEARKQVEEQERSAASRVEIWFMENVPFEYEVVQSAINGRGCDYDCSAATRAMIADIKRNTYGLGGDAVINVRINQMTIPDQRNGMIQMFYEAYGVAVKKK